MDPRLDRLAAVPIKDTCDLFPRHQILAINVTGKSAEYGGVKFPVLEVAVDADVPLSIVPSRACYWGKGPHFERVVQAG